jgi:hypothetical protein
MKLLIPRPPHKRGRRRGWVSTVPFQVPPVTERPPTRPDFLQFLPPLNSTTLEIKPLFYTCTFWGTFQIQTIAKTSEEGCVTKGSANKSKKGPGCWWNTMLSKRMRWIYDDNILSEKASCRPIQVAQRICYYRTHQKRFIFYMNAFLYVCLCKEKDQHEFTRSLQ